MIRQIAPKRLLWLLAVVFVCAPLTAQDTSATNDADEEAAQSTIQIGRETTYFTDPLDDDGNIDLLAALNRELSSGVTPENNAAYHLFRVLGPVTLDEIPTETLDQMGVEFDDADEAYVELVDDFVTRHGLHFERDSEYDAALAGPWSREANPMMATWIDANDAAMDRMIMALEHPRFYVPLLHPTDEMGLMGVTLEHVQMFRSIARSLVCRAHAHLQEGDIEAAIADIRAMHLLSRHVSQGGTLIEKLVAFAIDGMAYSVGSTVLASEQHMRHIYLDMEAMLDSLPPRSPMFEAVQLGERLMAIDMIMRLSENAESAKEQFGLLGIPPIGVRMVRAIGFDWNEVLREVNLLYDEQIEIYQLPDDEKLVRFAEFQLRMDEEIESMSSPAKLLRLLASVGDDQHEAEKSFSLILTSTVIPALSASDEAERRTNTQHLVARTALAVERFRAETGNYPETLDELAPEYLVEAPRDPYSDEPLRYVTEESTFVVYSVGRNRIDDGGQGFDAGPGFDDLSVRIAR